MFKNSGTFWNWFVVSSADANSVALTVKGFTSLAVVQAGFSLLGVLGYHPAFDLNGLGDALYAVVYGGLSAVSAALGTYGALRKLYLLIVPPKPAV